MSEVKLSQFQYAAFVLGDDDTGSWLWCNPRSMNADITKPFYSSVINGQWELYYDPAGRYGKVTATKQIIPNLRMAGFGKIPEDWNPYDYNEVINERLRTGEYRGVPSFFVNQGDI